MAQVDEKQPRSVPVGTDARTPYTEPGNHPVFANFRRWEGWVESGWNVNWLGVLLRTEYFAMDDVPERRYVKTPPLPFDEEYFEWIDLLTTVVEAEEQFTMIELGAGYGRWIVNAAAAANQYGGVPYLLIAVEAEPQHFQWMHQHLRDNAVPLESVRLVPAAVAGVDGRGRFEIGNAYEFYGQALLAAEPADDASVEGSGADGDDWNVRTVSLTTLLADLDRVDLIDVDIQGAEADVFEAAGDAVDEKVKRVHIETHTADVEKRLRVVFGELGWRKLWDFPSESDTATPYGVVHFQGGLQTWANPRFAR